MRERIIKIGVLTIVFVLAVIGFSFFTNRGNTDMTADMDSASLPTISFSRDGRTVNSLAGHKNEMNIPAMRDVILPFDLNTIDGQIGHYDERIDSMKYEIRTLDGQETLYEKTEENVGATFTLDIGNVLENGQEALLKITLYQEEMPVHYYTRIVKEDAYHVEECLDYIESLHDNILNKQNSDEIRRVLESNESGDNTTLQHVTIHSNIEHVMWGGLKPEIIGDIQMDIKEVKEAYTSAQLTYRVKCAGDNNEEEIYNVKEFFKVTYQNGKFYLLAYDRTMNEVFVASNVVLVSKGINLGITPEEIPYEVNKEGTIVAFVQENELWNYQKEEDSFALVFSFADSEKEDQRNLYDQHSLRILSMEDNGNMTFSVYGYMNRGSHEGESGLAIYYYKMEQNVIEEKAFIPSTDSFLMIEKELNKLAYYNAEQDALYVLVNGDLYKVNLTENTTDMLVENLQEGQYVTSDDGHLFAYQLNADVATEVEVWNFAKDSRQTVTADEGENIILLGFVANDFVYGIAKEENRGLDASGEEVLAMHRLEIRDSKNEVVKTYAIEGTYILSVSIEDNMITLKRGTKSGNTYKEIAEDYITNNAETANEFVSLKSYWTDLKETQSRLVFTEGIQDKKAKVLKPKQILQETRTTLDVAEQTKKEYYMVYGFGEQAGLFEEAGEAVQLADELAGVVISPKQNYAWEDGNRVSWYRNFEIGGFSAKSGETTLEACVRAILTYEGASADIQSALDTKSVLEVLSEYTGGEAIRFRECSSKDLFYLVDKGTPVIALKDSDSAVLMIGYDARTVTYVEPASGGIKTLSIEAFDEMVAGSGQTFIGYVK